MRETIYGPLLPIMSFRDLEDAANLVNESPNCRSAAILARTLEEARDFARRLHATSISLNDSILESAILDTESYSVLAPGTGCSSTGESAYLRFLRRQILLCTHGDAHASVLGEPDR
jgi:acyl-CoA reductase-like NAD-dependent aldehyde dehydrogenase